MHMFIKFTFTVFNQRSSSTHSENTFEAQHSTIPMIMAPVTLTPDLQNSRIQEPLNDDIVRTDNTTYHVIVLLTGMLHQGKFIVLNNISYNMK